MKISISHFISQLLATQSKEAIRGGMGGLFGIFCAGALATIWFGGLGELPLLIAPIGASAVLLFAVPSSPLAQPWPVLGGNLISAVIGVAVAHFIHEPLLAAAVAVGSAITLMTVLKCLHPPGGAIALTAVVGGQHIIEQGYMYALSPVLINSGLLLLAAVIFNRLAGRSYPHKPHLPKHPPTNIVLTNEDFENVLKDYGEQLDISPEDLRVLYTELNGIAECSPKEPVTRNTRGGRCPPPTVSVFSKKHSCRLHRRNCRHSCPIC